MLRNQQTLASQPHLAGTGPSYSGVAARVVLAVLAVTLGGGCEPQAVSKPRAEITACPATSASNGLACAGSFTCSYGQECCCGSCKESVHCSCSAGKFQCSHSDYCMGAQACSTGCGYGMFTTPSGCQACPAIQAMLAPIYAAAVDPYRDCSATADCAVATGPVLCGPACSFAVDATQTAAVTAALMKQQHRWCNDWNNDCYLPCPESGVPMCIQGKCRLVSQCDPAAMPTGTPCDDKDPCTAVDICTGPGECHGQPKNCDDGNPCTADQCSATGACVSMAVVATCTTAEPCSLGGICSSIQCVDAGLHGWRVALGPVDPLNKVLLAELGDAGVLLADSAGDSLRLRRLSPQGKLVWDHNAAGLGSGHRLGRLPSGFTIAAVQGITGGVGAQVHMVAMDLEGNLLWQLEHPVPAAQLWQVLALPAGGVAVVGHHEPKGPVAPSTFVLRSTGAGQVAGLTDLGSVGAQGGVAFAGAKPGSLAVVTGKAASAPSFDGQTDVLFARLDANGQVVAVQDVEPSTGLSQPVGLAPVGGGWLVGMYTINYGKGDKDILYRVALLSDTGEVLAKKALPGPFGPVLPQGDGALISVLGGVGAGLKLAHVDAAGAVLPTWAVPAEVVSGAWALAPVADGGLYLGWQASASLHVLRVVAPGAACP